MAGISVVIPVYNRQDLILETLKSVENQTLLPTEVLIVDDHSTDDSVKIVSDYSKKSNLKINILQNERKKGQCGATNFGIENSNGQFIALLDSDDLWAPEHLQQLLDAINKYPQAYVAFSAIKVFGDAKDTKKISDGFKHSVSVFLEKAFEAKGDSIWLSKDKLFNSMLIWGFRFRCQASLIKKELFLKYNLFFDEDIEYTLDAHFMTIVSYYTPFLYIDNIGLFLRRHSENDGNKCYEGKIVTSYEKRFIRLKEHFNGKKLDRENKKALKLCLLELQEDVILLKTENKGLFVTIKESVIFLKRLPCYRSLVFVIKLNIKKVLSSFSWYSKFI